MHAFFIRLLKTTKTWSYQTEKRQKAENLIKYSLQFKLKLLQFYQRYV